MKSVFRINITYLCLTLVSFNFIYSGCCCKKKPSNDDLKTRRVNAEAISGFINKRSGTNRARIRGNFLAVLNGDKYIIKYGRFTGSIKKEDINIKNIGDSLLMIDDVSRPDNYKIIFDENKCKLGDFVAALNLLSVESRNDDNEEYLAVEDLKGLCTHSNGVYINLDNGLIYKCDKNGYIGRGSKNVSGGKYTIKIVPCYKGNDYFTVKNNENIPWDCKKCGDPKKEFKTPLLNEEILNKFTFKVKIE